MKTDIYDIYGVWHVPFWRTDFFRFCLYGIVSVLLLLCIFILIRFFMRRRALVPVSPWKLALARLNSLEQADIFGTNNIENNSANTSENNSVSDAMQFYTAIIAIVRSYLQQRYVCDLAGKTDEELLDYMVNGPLDRKAVPLLQAIIQESGEAKFFPSLVKMSQIRHDLNHARRIVMITALEEPNNSQKSRHKPDKKA